MRKFLTLFAVLALVCSTAFSQTKNITGKITDQQNQPVPFASVRVKGTKVGVSADADGGFTIKARAGDILIVTGTGVTSKEITVGETSTLAVQVSRKESNLTEVVVTALGVQRQARDLGYATAKVTSDELTQARVTNVGTGLAAKVSGLQINLINNGVKPDLRITLRGTRSILGNNQALLVVDDIQLPINYLSTINPDDVANVSVLKGASASALYGSSASNGVIIVTTKRGRGKPVIKLSSTVNVESIAYTPAFQSSFGQNGGETAPAYAGVVHVGDNPYIWYVPYENQNYGPRFNGQKVPIGPPIHVFQPDGSFKVEQDSINYSGLPNAKSGFFNHGVETQNSITYSTGDDKSKFYMSFQDVNHSGIVPKDVSRRDNIRINGSRESGIFRADYNIGYTLTNTNTTAGSGVPFSWGTTPYVGGYTGGGSYFQNRPLYWNIINQPADVNLKNYKNWQTDPFASPDGYFNAYYGNPWWQIDQSRLAEKSNDLLATLALTLKPTSWLDLQYRAGIARDDYSNKYTQAGYTFAPWAIADTLGSGEIPGAVKQYSPSEGDAVSYNQRISSDFLASIHKNVGNFDIKFIGGTSLIQSNIRLFSTSANPLVIPDFYNISNRLNPVPGVSEYTEETRVLGVYGDLTVGYKTFLFLHGSLRNDWNSLLSPANRSYLYPSVDLAFIFTDAISSLKSSNFLSYGKLRAAHSKTAQVSIGPYALQNTFDVGPGFPFSSPGFTVHPAYANPDIKPELSTDDEIGLDLGFLNNRINFSAAVYNTITKNQTIPIGISSTTGYTSAYVNSGEMQNQGIELDLKLTPLLSTNDGFRWDVGVNFSYNKNKVKELGFGLPYVVLPNPLATQNAVTFNSVAALGLPYGQVLTNDWKRDPGGRIIVDGITGMPSLDPNLKLFGTTVPPTKVGITTSISYKGFTLGAVADGRFGAVIFNGIGPDLDFTGVSAYSASSGRQPFVIPNSVISDGNGKYNANTNVTAGSAVNGANGFWASTWNAAGSNYVNSADFWKLREVSLSYNIPKSALAHLRVFSAASIGVTGRNLITKRAKGNVWSDPEFSNTNGNASGNTDINQLPPTKFVGVNISLTF